MQLYIKILIISFPLVVALVLFWPTTNEGSLPGLTGTARIRPATPVRRVAQPARSVAKLKSPAEPRAAIYKWTDADGTDHFSDRPGSTDAVEHTPQEIGHYGVSADISQRIEAEHRNLAKVRLQETVSQPATRRVPQTADYKFSLAGASQKQGYVYLTGRITGGPACSQLRVFAQARSDEGRVVIGRQDIEFSGFGSALFEMEPSSNWTGRGRNRPQWEIVRLSARCLGR